MVKSGNKGEWSEIYALLKLLGETQIYAGDENLNRIEDIFYPIIQIMRPEKDGTYKYEIKDENNVIIKSPEGCELLNLPTSTFLSKANELLKIIKEAKETTFTSKSIVDFMESIYCCTLKAKSSDKTDIQIILHDSKTGMNPLQGFSIKSRLGGNSTLLNASGATLITYKIDGYNFNDDEIEQINSINSTNKVQKKISEIIKKGATLYLGTYANKTFKNNLVLIDSNLPEILSGIILDYYSSNRKKIKELVGEISNRNPLNYDSNDDYNYYEYKIKHFLTDVALGMKPATKWMGKYEANGGYLIVKEDGDVLCYHIYDKSLFEDYLYNNTYLDTPSTGRHGFGIIEKDEDNKCIFKLNFEIRFR